MTRSTKTLTDTNGNECAFIYYDQPHQRSTSGVYVEASNPDGAIYAGPFTPVALRDALGEVAPAGSYVRTDEQTRPLTARENLAALWESAHRPVGGRIPAGTAVITRSDHGNGDVRYQTLEATGRASPTRAAPWSATTPYGPENGEEYRLLDPPTRPEGAEGLADDMEDCLGDVKLEDVGLDGLADHLAAMGYRKGES